MGRIYTAEFSGQAETAQNDLFEIVAPADSTVIIHEVEFSQETEVADAAEEMLLVTLKRGNTTSGSGGISVTPNPMNLGDAAFGGTVEATNTTKATLGTTQNLWTVSWNVRIPLQKIWTPETRPVLSPSARAVFELRTTPADSITFAGTLTFEEIGG